MSSMQASREVNPPITGAAGIAYQDAEPAPIPGINEKAPHGAFSFAGLVGFEPTTNSLTGRRSTVELQSKMS